MVHSPTIGFFLSSALPSPQFMQAFHTNCAAAVVHIISTHRPLYATVTAEVSSDSGFVYLNAM